MIDLKLEIFNIFSEVDSHLAERWNTLFTSNITLLTELQQLNAMNLFWTMQLGLLNVNTFSEREYLATDVDARTWLKRFKKYVLPTIIAHGLPV